MGAPNVPVTSAASAPARSVLTVPTKKLVLPRMWTSVWRRTPIVYVRISPSSSRRVEVRKCSSIPGASSA